VPTPTSLPILRLCLSTSVESPPLQCVLTRCWINVLGSNMTIRGMNGKGDFASSYHMAVTATTNKIQVSLLQGSQHRMNQKSQPTFGFTISWSFSGASPFPASPRFVDEDRKEILRTAWIMQDEVDSFEDDGKAS
ncbi:AVID protein, partial [Grus americana]|nr:AVID protein [Grus americana]